MDSIPGRLQCAYCQRNDSHGGECTKPMNKPSDGGCLVFLLDQKGCIRNTDMDISVPLYYKVFPLKTWWDEWTINGADTKIRINRINGIGWDSKKGHLLIYCNCDYYVNEYDEKKQADIGKPKLKLIK